jgi:hypothetical protein
MNDEELKILKNTKENLLITDRIKENVIDSKFIAIIENEYAQQYLSMLNLYPTAANI